MFSLALFQIHLREFNDTPYSAMEQEMEETDVDAVPFSTSSSPHENNNWLTSVAFPGYPQVPHLEILLPAVCLWKLLRCGVILPMSDDDLLLI